MGILQGLKLASIDWVGPLGCNAVHPDSLGSSRETVLPAWHWEEGRGFLPWPIPGVGCQDLVRTKPQWLQLVLSPLQPQLGGSTFPPQTSTGSSGSPQPHLNANKKRNKVGARPWEL